MNTLRYVLLSYTVPILQRIEHPNFIMKLQFVCVFKRLIVILHFIVL